MNLNKGSVASIRAAAKVVNGWLIQILKTKEPTRRSQRRSHRRSQWRGTKSNIASAASLPAVAIFQRVTHDFGECF